MGGGAVAVAVAVAGGCRTLHNEALMLYVLGLS
jgi:hypothetical protein